MRKHKYIKTLMTYAGALITGVMVIAGCIGCDDSADNRGNTNKTTQASTENNTQSNKRYNVEDVVVVIAIDKKASTITVRKPNEPGDFVLTYNGGTIVTSKYGTQLLMEQVQVGEVARVRYVSGTQKLIELCEYDGAWENTSVVRWDVDYDKKLIYIGSDTYSYNENIFITSNGKKLDIREVSGIDELTVRGVGNKAYSVNVNKGHGYVRLTNTVNYVGGVIEIGDRITTIIVEDMVLAAPEGKFKLTATINGVGGSKEISVERGQETIVSLGSFEQAVTRYGTVHLNVFPEDAQAILTIDGVEMDYSKLMSIAYGKHKLRLTSNNYEDYEREITISSVYSTININMSDEEESSQGGEKPTPEKPSTGEKETTTSDGTGSGSSGTTSQNPGTNNGLICITAPTGAKVYMDGAYMGVSPVSFKKVAGEHTLIFKMDGYITKSYTIDVSEDTEDMILSFPAMLKAE